jgi:hypothetical protein
VPPNLLAAVGLGLRACAREAWLVPVGAVFSALRRAALWPAAAVLAAVVARAGLAALRETPLDPVAPFRGALVALASPRLVPLVLGLAAAGVLLSAALRVAWLSGALPTLAGALAGVERAPRFAAGVAYGLPRVLAAALVGLVAEAGASGFGLTLALAVARLVARAPGHAPVGPLGLAAASALALVVALAAPLAASVLTDAAVARAAVRGESPGRAFAGALRRLLARPGAFLLAAGGFAAAGLVAPLSVEGLGGVAMGFAQGVSPSLLAGPNLMLGALALAVSAALDVWWLATVASLACARGADDDAG